MEECKCFTSILIENKSANLNFDEAEYFLNCELKLCCALIWALKLHKNLHNATILFCKSSEKLETEFKVQDCFDCYEKVVTKKSLLEVIERHITTLQMLKQVLKRKKQNNLPVFHTYKRLTKLPLNILAIDYVTQVQQYLLTKHLQISNITDENMHFANELTKAVMIFQETLEIFQLFSSLKDYPSYYTQNEQS